MALLDRLRIGKADPEQVAAVIDIREFEEDARDDQWQAALALSKDHLDELDRAGRNL